MADEKMIQVQLAKSRTLEVSAGSKLEYKAGEYYLLPETVAQKWTREGYVVVNDKKRRGS